MLTRVLLLAIALLAGGHAVADDSGSERRSSAGDFDRAVAGTFLAEEGGSTAEAPRFFVLTLHADGTASVLSSSQREFDFTAEQGAWQKAGRRTVDATTIDFDFGEQPELRLDSIARVRLRIHFDPDFDEIDGRFIVDFFPPGFDVLDPRARPSATFAETFQGRRLAVIPIR